MGAVKHRWAHRWAGSAGKQVKLLVGGGRRGGGSCVQRQAPPQVFEVKSLVKKDVGRRPTYLWFSGSVKGLQSMTIRVDTENGAKSAHTGRALALRVGELAPATRMRSLLRSEGEGQNRRRRLMV